MKALTLVLVLFLGCATVGAQQGTVPTEYIEWIVGGMLENEVGYIPVSTICLDGNRAVFVDLTQRVVDIPGEEAPVRIQRIEQDWAVFYNKSLGPRFTIKGECKPPQYHPAGFVLEGKDDSRMTAAEIEYLGWDDYWR